MRQLALKIANVWGAGIFQVLVIGFGMSFLLGGDTIFPVAASEPVQWAFTVTAAVFVVIPCFIVGQVAVPLFMLLDTPPPVGLIWVVGGVGFCTVTAAQAVRVLLGPFGEKTETAYWWATAFFGVLLPCAILSLMLAGMNMPIYLLS